MIVKKLLIIASLIVLLEKVNAGKRTCFWELHIKNNQEHSITHDVMNIDKKPMTSCKSSQAKLCTEDCYQNKIERTVLANPSNAAHYCSRISNHDKNMHMDSGFRLEMVKSYSSCERWFYETQNPSRLCCETKCSCAISYKSNNKTNPLQVNIPLKDGNKNARFEYHCGNSIGDCLTHCRKEVGNFFNVPNIPLGHTPYPGNAVFVEYASGNTNVYPYKDKIFIGNLCCLDLSTLSPGLNMIIADPNCVGRKQIIDL